MKKILTIVLALLLLAGSFCTGCGEEKDLVTVTPADTSEGSSTPGRVTCITAPRLPAVKDPHVPRGNGVSSLQLV